MMRLLLALSLLFATPCWAQIDDKLFTAGRALEMVGPALAQAVIAVELCHVGDAAPWKKVVAAIDKRHAHCIVEDAGWKKLVEKPDALAGTFAFDSFLATRGAEARAQGATAYCDRVPWKLALVPGAVTEVAKATFLRQRPDVPREALDDFVFWIGWVRALGDDTRWTETACTDFWPVMKK
ncbi:MAG: hypothetical protein PSV46_15565 [Reyranella sp.]|nr:hypothetical protein [Reyranella sp.]